MHDHAIYFFCHLKLDNLKLITTIKMDCNNV